MTIRPILFSGPMIRALLEGRKTQTRRVISFDGVEKVIDFVRVAFDEQGRPVYEMKDGAGQHISRPIGGGLADFQYSPNYAVGDLLWVRETWGVHWANDDIKPSKITAYNWSVRFDADGCIQPAASDGSVARSEQFKRKRPSIFMPRWASRLTLKVTDVRVQRLQDISHGDALAEGVEMESADPPFYYVPGIWPHSITAVGVEEPGPHAERSFAKLWDSLNEKRGYGWDNNPWVIAVTFEVHRCNVDQFNREVAA